MTLEIPIAGAQAGRWHEIDHELHIGAWVNVRDEARRTVLLWAARQGACEAVTNLVNKTHGPQRGWEEDDGFLGLGTKNTHTHVDSYRRLQIHTI